MNDFNLEQYLKDRDNIGYKELNKKYNIIFDYHLGDSIGMPENWIIIFDKKNNNVCTFDLDNGLSKHTISIEDLNNIKECINKNKYIFTDGEVAYSPVLDGTTHTINVSSGNDFKSIETSNLWYWFFEGDVMRRDISEEEKKYTKCLINLINDIQKNLDKYDLCIELNYCDYGDEDE